MYILVVEDDAEVATFLVLGLREAGHVVEYAGTAADGLALGLRNRFDVVIVDRMLPGGADGTSVVAGLRGQGVDTPALFLSGLGELSDWMTGMEAGGTDYLVKPVSMEKLLPRIEALVQRTNGSDPSARAA